MEELQFKDLKPGKRYKGSGMVTADGDFQFRKYKERSVELDNEEDERLLADDGVCQVWSYQKKYTIKIDIKKKELSAPKLFTLMANQIKFINNLLFKSTHKK